MTYEIIWEERATNSAVRFLKDDPDGLSVFLDAIDGLADDPRPANSSEYGSPDLRRLHSGAYRAVYEITDATVTVVILHMGRRD